LRRWAVSAVLDVVAVDRAGARGAVGALVSADRARGGVLGVDLSGGCVVIREHGVLVDSFGRVVRAATAAELLDAYRACGEFVVPGVGLVRLVDGPGVWQEGPR
jgi:hypothetical protein